MLAVSQGGVVSRYEKCWTFGYHLLKKGYKAGAVSPF